MGNLIFIARQDTLEDVQIDGWLNDYKLHGEDSFAFNTPKYWEKMCLSPQAANDRRVNGDALEYVLTVAAPGGTATLPEWMALLCDTAEQAAAGLYAGLLTAEQLAQSSVAMAAVSNSETAMAAVSNSETAMAAVSNSETAMAAVTGSETAMNAICGVEMALGYLHESPYWDEAVKENSMAIAKAAVALANSNEFSVISSVAEMAENSSAMSAVAASATAMSAVAASATAMSAVADSSIARNAISASEHYNQYIKENDMAIAKLAVGFAGLASAGYSSMAGVAADATAMTAVAASSTAMTAVAASKTALQKIVAQSVARTAIEKSTTAINALKNSSFKTTYTDSSDDWNDQTVSGKGFVFTVKQNGSASAAYFQIDGGTQTKVDNTTVTLNKFYTSKWVYHTYYKSSNVVYIPIS